MERLRKVCIGAVLFVIACCIHCAGLCQALFNYESDPDLAKALEYDTELCGGDYDRADRALAEKHYLAYLERCKDSFQRARVYYELGVMYSTSINLKKGEKSDYNRASAYFRKCLEEEPERIGRATRLARTQLASMAKGGEERARARMEVYEWGLRIDKNRVRELWLPFRPGEVPTERQVTVMARRAKGLNEMTGRNMVADAMACPNAEVLLKEIIKRFPGTYAAGLAEGLLMRWPPLRPKDDANLR